jgi:hypothetical protein
MLIEPVDDAQFLALAHAARVTVPIEQAPLWDAVDRAIPGRAPWRRLVARDDEGEAQALLSLSRYAGRGFSYLWGRHAPVWLVHHAERPTPQAESELHAALRAFLIREAPSETFVRVHAWHRSPDLEPLLQTLTYDRTVVVDLAGSEEERMAALSRSTRKKLRRTLDDDAVVITEETQRARENFAEYYAILEETAARDGFGVYGPEVYRAMIAALGEHARVFVARRTDNGAQPDLAPGRAVSWILAVIDGDHGLNFYSGQTAEGRATNIGVRLRWHVFAALSREGVRHYDLMGVDSPLAPSLKGVGEFKRQFGPEVEVDPAWDVPLKPGRYRLLRTALTVKRALHL